jgi:hypothetical protein
MNTSFRISRALSWTVGIFAVLASLGGLFWDGLYRDNTLVTAAWRGNDLVTLLVAVPLLLLGLRGALRGSLRAHLLWGGALSYMLYNYIFYLYGAAFNSFFLLYAALVATSLYGLIFALRALTVDFLQISPRMPWRTVAVLLVFLPVVMGSIWIVWSAGYIFTHEVPQQIIQTGHPTGVVFATDLTLLLPAAVLAAILLWKKERWGIVIGSLILVKGVAYGLALVLMSLFAYEAGITTALNEVPFWLIVMAGSSLGGLLLYRNIEA